MNFVRYLQAWNFTLNAGWNKITLPEKLFVEQGSMLLWQTRNNGLKLACKSNSTVGDVLWASNNSLTNIRISQTTNIRIYVSMYGQVYMSYQEIKNWVVFPYPGVYQVSSSANYFNYSSNSYCSVIVSDG